MGGVLVPYRSIKVRLIPTQTQELALKQHAGTHRYAYNFAKALSERYYEERGESISVNDISKAFRKTYGSIPWIVDICKDVNHEAIRDYGTARSNSFRNHKDGYHTKYKSRKDSIQGFAVDARKLKFKGKVYLPKVGWVSVNQTPKKRIYKNPRVIFDGQYWYLSLGLEVETKQVELTEEVLGLDIGLKNLVTTSDGTLFENINKTKTVKKLERERKQAQREMARRYIKGSTKQSKNYYRSKYKHARICRKLTNIRENHIHQVSSALVKTKPKAIVLEDLKVQNLLSNHCLAKAIQDASWYKLRTYLTYKAEHQGIEIVLAPSTFPSSQLCSNCHQRFDVNAQKRTWGLDIRNWKCSHCEVEHDRDENAALNLKWYYNHQV